MSKGAYTLDFTDFDRKFGNLVNAIIPDYADHGVRLALDELKNDADNVPPRTPHKEGHLRGSGRVVNVKNVPGEVSGELKYGGLEHNVPYAHRLHEAEPGTINWSEPGVGSKYLESKLARFMGKYIAIIAEAIRRKK